MKDKVSVVIPVFQTKKFLSKCINSVLNQTYKNMEIILINDGSTDGSKEICNEFSENYHNVKVIHQRNQGVSRARNIGLEHTTGDFIMFLDSDDYIHPTMVETMMSPMDEYNIDITFCNFTREFDSHLAEVKSNLREGCYTLEEFVGVFFELLSNDIINNIGTKIYRKKVLTKGKIKFRENYSIREDIMFCLEAIINSKKLYFLNNNFYIYTQLRANDSLMSSYKDNFFEANEEFMVMLREFLFLNNSSEKTKQDFYNYYFNSLIGILINEATYHKERINDVLDKITKSNNFIESKKYISKSSFKKRILYILIRFDLHKLLKCVLISKYN